MLKHNRAYTLVEMLMATVLTLMMMSAVVQLFDSVGRGITNSRSLLDTNDRLRMAALQLERDLGGVTVTMLPPRRPESNEGYFEYTEGPIGPVVRPEAVYVNSDANNISDTTVIDNDDMLMMTVRSREPFVGRYNANNYIQSNHAEVAWFVRGRTLYRRVLVIVPPGVSLGASLAGFYGDYDVSARAEGTVPVANTLGDLTKPENRFAHRPTHTGGSGNFPFHPHFPLAWDVDASGGSLVGTSWERQTWMRLGLPTLQETSSSSWSVGASLPNTSLTQRETSVGSGRVDLRRYPHNWTNVNVDTGALTTYAGTRIAEDVVLTNVIGFDVKAWDPGAPTVLAGGVAFVPGDPGYLNALSAGGTRIAYGAYVDLNYMCQLGPPTSPPPYPNPNYTPSAGAPTPAFYGAGQARSGVRGTEPTLNSTLTDIFTRTNFHDDDATLRDAVYDTWSTHYENDGVQQFSAANIPKDTGTNGLDDTTYDMQGNPIVPDGVVDGPGEMETLPPYPVPLRGVQVTIRVYEPSTREVRQRTVQVDFLAK